MASKLPDMKTFIHDARNDEKLEKGEKRAEKIIIHFVEKIWKYPGMLKKEDEEYIKSIFTKV